MYIFLKTFFFFLKIFDVLHCIYNFCVLLNILDKFFFYFFCILDLFSLFKTKKMIPVEFCFVSLPLQCLSVWLHSHQDRQD